MEQSMQEENSKAEVVSDMTTGECLKGNTDNTHPVLQPAIKLQTVYNMINSRKLTFIS